jgi:hypothetical protein
MTSACGQAALGLGEGASPRRRFIPGELQPTLVSARRRRALALEEAELACARDGLGARGGTELAEDGARVRLYGVEGDVELGRDLAL